MKRNLASVLPASLALLAALASGAVQAADPATAPAASTPAATSTTTPAAAPAGKKQVGSGASSFAAAANAAAKANSSNSDAKSNELSTNVIGSQEAPTVLNVVPWKDKEVKVEKKSPTLSILNNLLQPLDRDVLQREVQYFRSLQEQKSQ